MKNYILIRDIKSSYTTCPSEIIGVYLNKYDAYRMALNLIKERFISESKSLPHNNSHIMNKRYDLYEKIFDAALNKAYRKALNLYNKYASLYTTYMGARIEYRIVPYQVVEATVELDIPTNLVKKQKIFQ